MPPRFYKHKLLLDEGRNDDAGRTLQSWFKDFPEKTWLASAYARILGLIGKQKEALYVMRRNMKASDYSVDAYIALAELQENFSLKEDSLETLQEGEEWYSAEVRLKKALAAFFVRQGESEKAEHKLQDVLKENRTLASADVELNQPVQTTATAVVLRGETLAEVSYRIYGTHKRWSVLFKANHDQISDPNRIVAGQVLKVPSWSRKVGL